MASTALVKNLKYDSVPKKPMFGTVVHSHPLPSVFQDLSFSSYVKPAENTAAKLNLHENEINPAIDDSEISIFDARKYFSETNNDLKHVKKVHLRRKELRKVVSRELPPSGRKSLVSTSSLDGYGRNLMRSRSVKSSTLTASSEASWNSQTGLLTHRPRSVGVSLKNFPIPADDDCKKRSSATKRWPFLSRRSCCIGKKSVETISDSENSGPGLVTIEENIVKKDNYLRSSSMDQIHKEIAVVKPQIKASAAVAASKSLRLPPGNYNSSSIQASWSSGRHFLDGVGPAFSFPIPSHDHPSSDMVPTLTKRPIVNCLEEVTSRKSLDVFQAIFDLSNIRHDHSGLQLNRSHFIPGSPISRDDDARSDASSDLFEIESLSIPSSYTNTTYRRGHSPEEAPTFNARRFASSHGINVSGNPIIQFDTRSMDEPVTPSVAASECYAPSEVSIDWSVNTAEGFDKASFSNFSVSASEIGSVRFLRERRQQQESGDGGHEGEAGKRKGNGLLLMGCRQEKAVSVQGMQPAVRCVAEGPAIFPLNVGNRPPWVNKSPASGSNSARLSLAFAA